MVRTSGFICVVTVALLLAFARADEPTKAAKGQAFLSPEIQEKLELSQEQKARVAQLRKEWSDKMGATALEMARMVNGVLSDQQRKKISDYQKEHPQDLPPQINFPLLLSKEGQKKLGITITAEQQTMLLNIQKNFDPKFDKHYQEAEDKFAEVLTEKQKAKLKEINSGK